MGYAYALIYGAAAIAGFSAFAAVVRAYFARVAADGGTTVDKQHAQEVYTDTNDYDPTLIQSCDSGKATVLYGLIPSQDLLLYQYTGAAAAYSLRSLSAGTINVVKVRRSGDDAELDFTATQVSDGTLAAWVTAGGGTEDGFVTTWYDQSGNTNDATQATAANQPKIVDSGSLVTENGKAAIDFDGSDDSLATASAVALTNQSIFAAIKLDTTITSASSQSRLWSNDAATADIFVFGSATSRLTNERLSWLRLDVLTVYGSGQTSSDISLGQYLYSALFNTSPSTAIYQNGSILSLTDTSGPAGGGAFTNSIYPAGFQRIGNNSAGTTGFDGKVQEMIVYATDESANRTGIEANINDYYNIYP